MATISFADILKDSDIKLAAEQVEFKLIEDGDYECEIVSAEAGVSQAGNPKITLTLQLEGSNRKQWYILNFSENEKSRAITLRTLKSLGLDPAELIASKADPNTVFVGKRVVAAIITDEWEGKQKNKVKWINPVPGVDYTTDLSSAAVSAPPASPFG